MKLIIQIPCYNEGETLRIALDALPRSIEGIDKIEYLIIDDGSVDNTVSEARDWGVNYIVHFCKNKGLANYRAAMSFITREDVAKKLFDEIAPKYAERNGGYTRITRIGARRGDAAEMAVIELV